MAIHLHDKFAPGIVQAHTIESLVAGKTSGAYSWDGVNAIKLATIVTQALGDYSRTTGLPTAAEVQDTKQTLTLALEKAFNLRVDKLNAGDQEDVKQAGRVMSAQLKEQATPYFDKYAIGQYAYHAGKSVILAAATSKANIVGYITDAATWFLDSFIPEDNRFLFLRSADYAFVKLSPEFLAVDTSVGDITMKGVVGMIAGFKVVPVPSSYLPTNVRFVAWHKESVVNPMKVRDLRSIDSESFFGKLLQGLFQGDAFIVASKSAGVYCAVANGSSGKVADSVITPTSDSFAVTNATSGATIYYTLDGSDPRYSDTRLVYASAVTLTDGQTIKAVGIKATLVDGDVASATYTA